MNTKYNLLALHWSLILVVVIIATVTVGCGPRTAEERKNYIDNIEKLGHPKNQMNFGVIVVTAFAFVGWAAYLRKIETANFACLVIRRLTIRPGFH